MPYKPWTTLYTATKGVSKSWFSVVSLLGVGGRIPIAPQTAACVPALLCIAYTYHHIMVQTTLRQQRVGSVNILFRKEEDEWGVDTAVI